jgi:hypothetical protein
MDDCHAFYLFQEILQAIIGSIDTAHTKYEADCLDWQSAIDDSHELLCKADMLQFKELCDNNYLLCKDEYDLYKEWTKVIEARPRYINIMYGWITDKDEQAWNDYNNRFDDYSDNNRKQAFFLVDHQMLAYHQWLSYCPDKATLFQNFEVSKPVCTASTNEKWSLIEFSYCWYAYQAITKQALGFSLTTGMNGLEVNYKLGSEVAAKMAVIGFVAPVMNPKTANKRHAEGVGAGNM